MADQGPVPAGIPIPIRSLPGINRDSTIFSSQYHADGQWTRWDDCNDGSPQKIGGLQCKTSYILGIPRGIDVFPSGGLQYTHVGSMSALQMLTIQIVNGIAGLPVDRTPATGFTANANNLWQFDQMWNSGGGGSPVLLAHAGRNLSDIDSSVTSQVYYGTTTSIAPLVPISGSDVSGGACAIGQFMFYYGSGGFLGWSDTNAPATLGSGLAGTANPTAQKIVKGMPISGGTGNSPAGIFWSLDSVIVASFVGGTVVFNIDNKANFNSILSSSCPVEYDGIYYWIGTSRFMMFNGVVQELKNRINKRDFFENLNYAYRQKVFGFKVEAKGEIWWCYPRGAATECNWAIIYNTRLGTWYDTPLPIGMSSGCYAQIYPFGLVGGVVMDSVTNLYKVWQNETGVDLADDRGAVPTAIMAFYETANMAPVIVPLLGAPIVRGIMVEAAAMDFLQSQSMNFYVNGRSTANGPDLLSDAFVFSPPPQTGSAALIHPKTTRNQIRFRFESNTLGGNFTAGIPIAYCRASDGRSET